MSLTPLLTGVALRPELRDTGLDWSLDVEQEARRWCSMKVCGNRMKARRHYQRNRPA
jgi:hypothetical protein